MSALDQDSDDIRRRRIRYRAGHRGIREMDLLMGSFARDRLDTLTSDELTAFERLLDASDHDVLSWISGDAPTPSDHESPVLDVLKAMSLTPDDYV